MLLATQYGMASETLAARLGVSTFEAYEMLNQHRELFAQYWRWSDDWVQRALQTGTMWTAFGWTCCTGITEFNERSIRNWPVQATGADVLRIACILATRHGIKLLAPVHDAVLIEAPINRIEADVALMRLADLFFAFPGIILALAVAAALGPQLRNAVIAVVAVSWPSYARLVRSLVLTARTAPYVVASRMLGASGWRVLFTDIRPNVAGPVLVLAALDLGNAVLLLSGLSFLGLGAQPPTAEWGAMVAEGTQNFNDWWVGVFPGLAILTVVLAFNFIGDALRDALDPRTARTVRLS